MEPGKESLAASFHQCRESFKAIINLLPHASDVAIFSKSIWEDEASRLQLWGANIGAAQSKANTSLDFRLRDADTVRQQIHKNLSNLDDALREALECVKQVMARNEELVKTSTRVNNTAANTTPTPPSSLEPEKLEPNADNDSDDSTDLAEDLQDAFDDAASLINSLFRMTLYIRNPSRRDQLKHRDTSAVANFEAFDVSHIRDKFPRAGSLLTERLGQANTVRRANLLYWERHHKKLAYDELVTDNTDDKATLAPLSESVATAFLPLKDDNTADTRSHFSGTSYMSSLLGGNTVRRPDLPEAGQGGTPFQCPICCYMITASDQREWMKHVFFDLQPYVCIFTSCKTPLLLYENRRDWFAHVLNNHLSSGDTTSRVLTLECSLCHEIVQSLPSIRRHLARHLEEVALFSLPNSLFGEETGMVNDDKTMEDSSGSELAGVGVRMGEWNAGRSLLHDQEDISRQAALSSDTRENMDSQERESDDSEWFQKALDPLELGHDQFIPATTTLPPQPLKDSIRQGSLSSGAGESSPLRRGPPSQHFVHPKGLCMTCDRYGYHMDFSQDPRERQRELDNLHDELGSTTSINADQMGSADGVAHYPPEQSQPRHGSVPGNEAFLDNLTLDRQRTGFRSAPFESIRSPSVVELAAMQPFARHASQCEICNDPVAVAMANGNLCQIGDTHAQSVGVYIEGVAGRPISKFDRMDGHGPIELRIPVELEVVRKLIRAMELGLDLRSMKSRQIRSPRTSELVRPGREEVDDFEDPDSAESKGSVQNNSTTDAFKKFITQQDPPTQQILPLREAQASSDSESEYYEYYDVENAVEKIVVPVRKNRAREGSQARGITPSSLTQSPERTPENAGASDEAGDETDVPSTLLRLSALRKPREEVEDLLGRRHERKEELKIEENSRVESPTRVSSSSSLESFVYETSSYDLLGGKLSSAFRSKTPQILEAKHSPEQKTMRDKDAPPRAKPTLLKGIQSTDEEWRRAAGEFEKERKEEEKILRADPERGQRKEIEQELRILRMRRRSVPYIGYEESSPEHTIGSDEAVDDLKDRVLEENSSREYREQWLRDQQDPPPVASRNERSRAFIRSLEQSVEEENQRLELEEEPSLLQEREQKSEIEQDEEVQDEEPQWMLRIRQELREKSEIEEDLRDDPVTRHLSQTARGSPRPPPTWGTPAKPAYDVGSPPKGTIEQDDRIMYRRRPLNSETARWSLSTPGKERGQVTNIGKDFKDDPRTSSDLERYLESPPRSDDESEGRVYYNPRRTSPRASQPPRREVVVINNPRKSRDDERWKSAAWK